MCGSDTAVPVSIPTTVNDILLVLAKCTEESILIPVIRKLVMGGSETGTGRPTLCRESVSETAASKGEPTGLSVKSN